MNQRIAAEVINIILLILPCYMNLQQDFWYIIYVHYSESSCVVIDL